VIKRLLQRKQINAQSQNVVQNAKKVVEFLCDRLFNKPESYEMFL
jgi:hypothetical protein